jgi:hypothetical protein
MLAKMSSADLVQRNAPVEHRDWAGAPCSGPLVWQPVSYDFPPPVPPIPERNLAAAAYSSPRSSNAKSLGGAFSVDSPKLGGHAGVADRPSRSGCRGLWTLQRKR